jgi:hypothetical protein
MDRLRNTAVTTGTCLLSNQQVCRTRIVIIYDGRHVTHFFFYQVTVMEYVQEEPGPAAGGGGARGGGRGRLPLRSGRGLKSPILYLHPQFLFSKVSAAEPMP